MANTKDKASDPQDKKKVTSHKTINATEDASKKKMSISEVDVDKTTPKEVIVENDGQKKSENLDEATKDFSQLTLIELVEILQKKVKAEQWFADDKNIKEIIQTFDSVFKSEIQEKKEIFIKEEGNEIDFYFKPQYKNTFDQVVREYKKNKRTYFQEREQSQKLNLDRKLEIIESLKMLINVDENINTIYKKFKNSTGQLAQNWTCPQSPKQQYLANLQTPHRNLL